MLEVSGSGAGAVAASTRGEQSVGASMGVQMEEGASEVPVASEAWSGMAMMSEARAKEGAPEVPSAEMAMGQVLASTPPAPSTIGGATLEELPQPEGSVSARVGAGPSRSLV